MELTKKRYAFLDLIKCIAIFFVIIYHGSYYSFDVRNGTDFVTCFNVFIRAVLGTCVPLFFFVNGALLLNKELDIKKHCKKIIMTVLASLVFTVVIQIIYMLMTHEKTSPAQFVLDAYCLGMGWTNYLWFFAALVVVYIFYPLIKLAFKQNEIFRYFFAVVFVCTIAAPFAVDIIDLAGRILHISALPTFEFDLVGRYNPFSGIRGYAIFYFMLGGVLLKNREKLKKPKIKIIAVASIVVSMLILAAYGIIIQKHYDGFYDAVWNSYDSIFTVVIVIAIFVLCLDYNGNGIFGKTVSLIGKNTLGIYVVHFPLVVFLSKYYIKLPFSDNIAVNLIFSAAILFISLGICFILKKIPVVRKLFTL